MSRTPCPVCDFPLATGADSDIYARSAFGDDDDARVLGIVCCWSAFGSDHRGPVVDWRARALEAERRAQSAESRLHISTSTLLAMTKHADEEEARALEADGRVEVLEGALRKYGRHGSMCDVGDTGCDCGLSVALSPTPPKPALTPEQAAVLQREACAAQVASTIVFDAIDEVRHGWHEQRNTAASLIRATPLVTDATPLEAAVAEVTR